MKKACITNLGLASALAELFLEFRTWYLIPVAGTHGSPTYLYPAVVVDGRCKTRETHATGFVGQSNSFWHFDSSAFLIVSSQRAKGPTLKMHIHPFSEVSLEGDPHTEVQEWQQGQKQP